MDPEKLARFSDRAMPRNYHALQAGDIDVMQAFEPFISMAEKDQAGDILYAASTRGPTAYTAFIATREACTKYRDVPKEILASSLGRYKAAGLWSRETRMIPQGFARLAQSLHSGGFISRMPGYDECVEPTLNGIRT